MFENDDTDLLDDKFDNIIANSQKHFEPPNNNIKRNFEHAMKTVGSKKLRLHTEEHEETQRLLRKINCKRFDSVAEKRVVRRKFPGPAGLLSDAPKDTENKATKQEILCSQSSNCFGGEIWEKMLEDYGKSVRLGFYLTDKYNVAWIKSRAACKKLINQKAPFLAAIICNTDNYKEKSSIRTLLLKDATGEIEGTVQQDLFEEYSKQFVAGNVIILKQFSVLTTNFGKSNSLVITANNLIAFYTENKGSQFNRINVTKISDLNAEDIINCINDIKQKAAQKTLSSLKNKTKFSDINGQHKRNEIKAPNLIKEKFNCDFKDSGEDFSGSQIIFQSQTKEEEIILKDIFSGLDANDVFDEF